MNKSLLKNNKISILIVFVVYLFFFVTGLIVYKDFGLSSDEWILRYEGFKNLKYIYQILSPSLLISVTEINEIINQLDVLEYASDDLFSDFYGSLFGFSTAFIEYKFNITDSRDYYLFRHYTNHIIFLISNFYFFLIVKNRYNNIYWGVLGALLLFLSPRIFANSFYNHKDLLFLSFFIINLYYGISFLNNQNIKSLLLFSLTTALSTDIRIIGIYLPFIIIFFSYIKYLRIHEKRIIVYCFFYIIISSLLIILFWPYLWENPFSRFIKAFVGMSAFDWGGLNLYFGNYIYPSNLPWHYTIVWIGITTPLFYLALLIIGSFYILMRLKKRLYKITSNETLNDLWRGEKELQDLIYFICFASPIFIVILFNSNLYDGWRQLYFIYPCILLVSLNALYIIKIKFFYKKTNLFIFLLTLMLVQVSYMMVKYHPHQNTYFNQFAGNNIEEKFEIDYWGLGTKQAYEHILINDNRNKILIGSASTIDLRNGKKILKKQDRDRILISENNEADYIIDNYRNWHGASKKEFKIPADFKILKEIFIGKQKIISIYQRI